MLVLALLLAALGTARAGQETLDVDLEAVTPRRAEELRQRGIELPRASASAADPRTHGDFIDGRVTAVGYGLTVGGYLLYCEGVPLPVLVPESQVDLGRTHAVAGSEAIHPDREAALTGLKAATYAYYRGAGGALIVPTLFSPASTPRIARTMLAVHQDLGQTVERELKVLLLNLTAAKVLQGVFSRVARVEAEPAPPPRPLPRTTPDPTPRSTTSPPVPGGLAPSPGLVRALTGHNPTPQLTHGQRLPQDVAVSPKTPKFLPTGRPIASSPSQNAQLQADIRYLYDIRAENIRVNQQQVTVDNSRRVGTNRPDLQFDYRGRRYHVEYDTPKSGCGSSHQARTTANDPTAETILLTVP